MALLAILLQACGYGGLRSEDAPEEPVRWILVERRYGDVVGMAAGDGAVNPDAMVLAFQPLYQRDLTWDIVVRPDEHFVELVGFSPRGPASPGEVVTAMVRVGQAKPGQQYRLEATPSTPDVRILGSAQAMVTGSESSCFQFTSRASGRGGIAVSVQRIIGEQ
jgi:hypothetical protein